MVQPRVEVGKGVVADGLFALFVLHGIQYGQRGGRDGIEPRAAHAYGQGRSVAPEWSRNVQVAAHQSHTHLSAPALKVGLLHPDVHNAGGPSAVLGRKDALVKVHPAECGHVERREHAAQVAHLIERQTFVEKKVLVVLSAAHVKARKALYALRHARQYLQGTHHVGLTHQGGHFRNFFGIQALHAHLRREQLQLQPVAHHHGLTQAA